MAKHVRRHLGLITCLFIIFGIAGCSTSSSSGGGSDEPLETQDISGVWVGNIGNTFAVGIITEDDKALFIGQDTYDQFNQFISPDGSHLNVTPESAIFSGELDLCVWDTGGPAYSCLPLQPGQVIGAAATKRILGAPPFGGAYTYDDNIAVLFLIYNTTYDVSPDLGSISGVWKIENSWKHGNTLTLTIVTSGGNNITGSDTLGNNFSGTISIHYSNPPRNVYDVSLVLNGDDDDLLTGLATYVSQMNSEGIDIPTKTLVIGATNSGRTVSLSGLAVEAED